MDQGSDISSMLKDALNDPFSELKLARDGKLARGGLYVTRGDDWYFSVYLDVKDDANDVEMAIAYPKFAARTDVAASRVQAWLDATAAMLGGRPAAARREQVKAYRCGLSAQAAVQMIHALHAQLRAAPADRWKVAAPGPVRPSLPPEVVQALDRMLQNARSACAQSGSVVTTIAKTKELRMSEEEFRGEVAALLASRHCAITQLQLDFTGADPELAPSLDRKDSDGHYERGNLQVVARFVNRWKSDMAEGEFRRLVALMRQQPAS